jgi:16S rRNA (uracil1498-N3)-methyltransferase
LRSVLRKNAGDTIRVFNGRNGEWLAVLHTVDKKNVTVALEKQMRPQPAPTPDIHLLFAPIKKSRMDFLIEKAVELGATRLRPVITHNTEVRTLNDDRIVAQMTEAAEQCERLDRPAYARPVKLEDALAAWPAEIPLLACLERTGAKPVREAVPRDKPCAVLIGPEGGFTKHEIKWLLALPFIVPVSLGPAILRSETAACYALAAIGMGRATHNEV